MRKIALLAPALLAACAAAPAQPPRHGEVAGYVCNAAGTDRFIGQAATAEIGAAIMRATHSRSLRWVAPGMMVTMEFSPSRVTVRIDPEHKVSAINCG
jgi:hypothetical protein